MILLLIFLPNKEIQHLVYRLSKQWIFFGSSLQEVIVVLRDFV